MSKPRNPEEAQRQIDALNADNRALTEKLQQRDSEYATLVRQRDELDAQIKQLQQGSDQPLEEARRQIEKLSTDNRALTERLERRDTEYATLIRQRDELDAQIKQLQQGSEKPYIALPAAEMKDLLNSLLQSLSGFKGFEVREAAITVKLAAAQQGDKQLFMLPVPGAAIDSATLHEIKFNLWNSEEK